MRGEGTDLIISAASSEFLLPAKAATLITNILCHDIQETWHHEAVVMFQEEMNSHCLNVYKKIYQKAMDECFTNEDTIIRLVDALNFYFRFSIAYNDGVKEWGEHYYPQENWDSATQKLNEVLALRYYNLLNSSVSIIRYSELNDDVFSKSILENNSNDDIIDTIKLEEKSVIPDIVQTVFDNTELWHKETVDNSPYYYDEREEYFWFQDIDMDGTVEFITGPAISGAHACHSFYIWKVENNQLQKVPYIYNSGYQENALMLWHNYSELIDFEHPSPIDSFMLKLFKNTENGHFEYIYTMQDGVANESVASIYEFDCNTKKTKEIFSIGVGSNYTEYLVNANVVLEGDFKSEYNRYISKLQLYDTSVIKLNYYDYSAMSDEQKKDMLLTSYNAWQYSESDKSINLGMNSVVAGIKDSSSGLNEEYPLFIGIVNTEKDPLNVRKSPSINAEIIGKIDKGTTVDVYSEAGGWCEIRYNGQVGYVSKEFINCEIGGYEKPVIYLYPNEKTDVSVKVNFKNGRFTCTYPDYNDGWNVTAYPDGKIINKNDNDEYSYLYWEGEGQINYDFSSGFVVKCEDTAKFLKEKLSYMGLTPKEYNEFIVYWLPIMQENEYNLVSFQMENYDDSAKLNITPEPDSILRIFMAFKETDDKTTVPQQKLEKFERKGFTVIEWGGAEVK